MAEYIASQMHWDELLIGASKEGVFTPFKLLGYEPQKDWENISYQVDLKFIRDSQQSYLSTRSSNTRYQINRSLKRYEKKGALEIVRAESSKQAIEWIDEAAPLHKERWQNHESGSGFENPKFVQFHKCLIEKNIANGVVDILKVSAGDYVIGYLYNIIQDKEVKFYLSAIRYDKSEKNLKPGLVAHHLAIDYYNSRNFDVYDFMGGDSQYKRSLSTQASPLYFMRIQQPWLKFKLENKLRKVKQRYAKHPKYEEQSEDIQFLVTGGCQNQIDNGPQYNNARAVYCSYNANKDELEVLSSLDYQPDTGIQHPETNITFKAGSVIDHSLWVPTETEILKCKLPSLEIVEKYSHSSFNDLHHVVEHNEQLLIANTGNNCATLLQTQEGTVLHHSANASVPVFIDNLTDYRKIKSTKPHLSHPNFCFVINGKIWVTRCDLMDAVCVEDFNLRIDIGQGLIHDGVIHNKHIYFTTVDGKVIVFNTETLTQIAYIDLKDMMPNISGWFRGILPLSNGKVLVGMSKLRASKRLKAKNHSPSQIFCIDIYRQQVIWQRDTLSLGLDTIFSLLPYTDR